MAISIPQWERKPGPYTHFRGWALGACLWQKERSSRIARQTIQYRVRSGVVYPLQNFSSRQYAQGFLTRIRRTMVSLIAGTCFVNASNWPLVVFDRKATSQHLSIASAYIGSHLSQAEQSDSMIWTDQPDESCSKEIDFVVGSWEMTWTILSSLSGQVSLMLGTQTCHKLAYQEGSQILVRSQQD